MPGVSACGGCGGPRARFRVGRQAASYRLSGAEAVRSDTRAAVLHSVGGARPIMKNIQAEQTGFLTSGTQCY